MSFPREENIRDLVPPDAQYVERAAWRLFEDLEGDLQGKNVLMVLGNRYTILSAAEFARMATRILTQL